MKSSFTYRQKNYLLIVAAILLGVACYQFAIKKTVTTYREIRELENTLAEGGNVTERIAHLQAELFTLEKSLGISSISRDEVQREFLDHVSILSDSLALHVEEIEPIHIAEQSGVMVATHRVKLDGAFANQVKLIRQLESGQSPARIVACDFEKKTELLNRTQKLYVTIYAQTILQ